MDRERRLGSGGNDNVPCADIRIDNLHVHGVVRVRHQGIFRMQRHMPYKNNMHRKRKLLMLVPIPRRRKIRHTLPMVLPLSWRQWEWPLLPRLHPSLKRRKHNLCRMIRPRQPNRYESKGEVQATLPESTEQRKRKCWNYQTRRKMWTRNQRRHRVSGLGPRVESKGVFGICSSQ